MIYKNTFIGFLCSWGLICSLLFHVPITYADISFPDVTEQNSYYNDVLDVATSGIMEGYDDGLFRPTELITRAEFIKTLLTAAQCRDCSKERVSSTLQPFPDVVHSSWYFPCIIRARELGLITGYLGSYDQGLFAPETTISRAESITLLMRANGIVPDETSPLILNDVSPYSWYSPYMKTAVELEIIPYHNGYLAPEEKVSRAEIARLLRTVFKDKLCRLVEQPTSDSDQDGVSDENDQCPDMPGVEANNGCPEDPSTQPPENSNNNSSYSDRDNDGVADDDDLCPDIPGGLAHASIRDGCPSVQQNARNDAPVGLLITLGECNTCPCPTADYQADIRAGDILFAVLQETISKTIYTISNMYYIGE